ncbi:MAG TPA: hypothetical protein ENG40_03550 [Thermoprotei archaeon]|nr:hypothetical protein [Thermoprotei archaeon]
MDREYNFDEKVPLEMFIKIRDATMRFFGPSVYSIMYLSGKETANLVKLGAVAKTLISFMSKLVNVKNFITREAKIFR